MIAPGSDVVAVVGVAPFATDLDHWVLPLEDVKISVEREETAVEILADDRTVGPASVDRPVCLTRDGGVDVVRLESGVSPFN